VFCLIAAGTSKMIQFFEPDLVNGPRVGYSLMIFSGGFDISSLIFEKNFKNL
jgi:hypothetical protein